MFDHFVGLVLKGLIRSESSNPFWDILFLRSIRTLILMTIMNSFISFLSPRKMKYFVKLHNVIREKGETNNFRFAGDDDRKFDNFFFFFCEIF